jgi:4-alpha-glucanotransferase
MLARLYGVQTSYVSASGKRVSASMDSLVITLRSMGVDATRATTALRSRIRHLRGERLSPIVTAWNGRGSTKLRVDGKSSGVLQGVIELEDGEAIEFSRKFADLPTTSKKGPGGEPEILTTLRLPGTLPMGYHRLRITIGRTEHEALIISAPVKSYRPDLDACDHEWGLFCPMYALRSERSLGCGDLTDLRTLANWQAGLGGRVVGTLPMLAVYLDEPFDPSPYSPVSRLFWNELFIDPTRAPEFDICPEAQKRMRSTAFKRELSSLTGTALVQYRRAMALRRSVLEPLAERFFSSKQDAGYDFTRFQEDNPLAGPYAKFRAVMERQRVDWLDWSQRLRDGKFRGNDFDPANERFHLYVQYLFTRQLEDLTDDMRADDGLVYLDLPVGVRQDGFDVFRYPELFTSDVSVGAPPDPYFTSGQRWGFPAMLPDRMREQEYEYLIASLRNHMRHCDYLRLDHVMAFYRLFWIADGLEARDGVYVHYPDEELWAILSLESHRNRCRLVGENLGTVPPRVNKALSKHEMGPLFVGQYEIQPNAARAMRPVTPGSVASANTHDMPPFAKFLSGDDIDERVELGMFDASLQDKEHTIRERQVRALSTFMRKRGLLRQDDAASMRDAVMSYLADSDADFLLVNIEDLWLESHWQNVPGTTDEYPNWRHKLRLDLEAMRDDPDIERLLRRIDELRKSHRQDSEARVTRD